MTSITTFGYREQSNQNNTNDENTSNDSLLLMADTFEDRAPLLNINDDEPVLSNDIPLRSRLLTTHCHVPDEKFDYAARNRLIVVLVLCIGFMIVEIIGRFVPVKNRRSICDLSRWYSFQFHGCDHRCSTYVYRCGEFYSVLSGDLFGKKTTDTKTFIRLHSSRFDDADEIEIHPNLAFRNSRCSRQCFDHLGSDWNTGLHGHQTLY